MIRTLALRSIGRGRPSPKTFSRFSRWRVAPGSRPRADEKAAYGPPEGRLADGKITPRPQGPQRRRYMGYEPEPNAKGKRLIWLEEQWINKLEAIRMPPSHAATSFQNPRVMRGFSGVCMNLPH